MSESNETKLRARSSDWTVWFGGACPVAHNVDVEVIYRKGKDSGESGSADGFGWGHRDTPDDIIAYRPLSAPSTETSGDQAPSEAAATLKKVCDLIGIGVQARTESTILTNIENMLRFTMQLRAVEHDLFPQPELPEDDDPYAETHELPAPNSWGAKDDADYVAQFRAALLARWGAPQPAAPADFPPRIMALLHQVADRKGTEHYGPFQDGDGEPLQDDADAALAWIALAAPQPADPTAAWEDTFGPRYESEAAPAPAEPEDLNRDLLLTTLHVLGLGSFKGTSKRDADGLANAIREALATPQLVERKAQPVSDNGAGQ